ncbi:unnamed protein product, partial [Pocillopora meandrina]
MEDCESDRSFAKYTTFSIADESDDYRVMIVGMQLYQRHCCPASRQFLTKFFFRHRNMRLTTRDRDDDVQQDGDCAVAYRGGWWYNACHNANPNGL